MLRQPDHAEFAGAISAEVGEPETAGKERDIDDSCRLAMGKHRTCSGLADVINAVEIDINGGAPQLFRHLDDRRRRSFAGGAGMVDQASLRSEHFFTLGNADRNLIRFGHIAIQRERLAPYSPDLVGNPPASARADRSNRAGSLDANGIRSPASVK